MKDNLMFSGDDRRLLALARTKGKATGSVAHTMAVVLCGLVALRASTAYAQSTNTPQAREPLLSRVQAVYADFSKEAQVYRILLRESGVSWAKHAKKLQTNQAEFAAAHAAASSVEAKKTLVTDYLKQQQDGIQRIVEDFDFVCGKLDVRIPALRSLADKMAMIEGMVPNDVVAANTSAISAIAEMEASHRQWRQLPNPPEEKTSADYIAWHKNKFEIERQFRRAEQSYRISMGRSLIDCELGKALEAAVVNADRYCVIVENIVEQIKTWRLGLIDMLQLDTNNGDWALKQFDIFIDKWQRAFDNEHFSSTVVSIQPLTPMELPPMRIMELPPMRIDDFDVVSFLRKMTADMGASRDREAKP